MDLPSVALIWFDHVVGILSKYFDVGLDSVMLIWRKFFDIEIRKAASVTSPGPKPGAAV